MYTCPHCHKKFKQEVQLWGHQTSCLRAQNEREMEQERNEDQYLLEERSGPLPTELEIREDIEFSRHIACVSKKSWVLPFLKALWTVPNISRAAIQAGVPRSTVNMERLRNKKFAEAWRCCLDRAIDELESFCFAKASGRVSKNAGSDLLALALLNAHRGDVYRHPAKSDLASDTTPVTVQLEVVPGRQRPAPPPASNVARIA